MRAKGVPYGSFCVGQRLSVTQDTLMDMVTIATYAHTVAEACCMWRKSQAEASIFINPQNMEVNMCERGHRDRSGSTD